jgi:hypothetical protein
MRAHPLLVLSILFCVSAFQIARVQAEQDPSETPSAKPAQTQGSEHAVEGNVVSMTGHTLVVRSDDNQYHLFTYDAQTVHADTVKTGSRISVTGGAPDENGVRVAQSVTVIHPGGEAAHSGQVTAQDAVPPSPQVSQVSKGIESEARRFHVGGRIGSGFSPQLFMFGPQAQFGPFFSTHLLFRPNVEFGFGEVTYMFAVNGEAAYRFSSTFGQWTPYFGMGPSFNFINHAASTSTVCFCDFAYKAGFNVFVGAQKHKTFVEMKTALWSRQAPVLRLFVGYNF